MRSMANNMPENATLFQPTHPAYELAPMLTFYRSHAVAVETVIVWLPTAYRVHA